MMVSDITASLLLKDIRKLLLHIMFKINEHAFIALLLCSRHHGGP